MAMTPDDVIALLNDMAAMEAATPKLSQQWLDAAEAVSQLQDQLRSVSRETSDQGNFW